MEPTVTEAEKGTLVYIPANVRLTREKTNVISSYVVTEKPVHCLVVGSDDKKPVKKFNVIYKGTTWTVRAKDVYEVNKEKEDVSYIG
tara:strand:- start:3366 stop:3626 length:261 start_codon:yes stop_codon:yes gene_type:complete